MGMEQLDDTEPDVNVTEDEVVITFDSTTLNIPSVENEIRLDDTAMTPSRVIQLGNSMIASMRDSEAERGMSEEEGSPYIEHRMERYGITLEGFDSIWTQIEAQTDVESSDMIERLIDSDDVDVMM